MKRMNSEISVGFVRLWRSRFQYRSRSKMPRVSRGFLLLISTRRESAEIAERTRGAASLVERELANSAQIRVFNGYLLERKKKAASLTAHF